MRRRKLLSGLGVGLAGGATVIGTGAFDQVNATRSVTVSTSNDSSVNLAITGDPAETITTSDGVVTIDLSNVNKNAVTTLGSILEFGDTGNKTIGSNSGNYNLELTIQEFSNDAVDFYQQGTTTTVVGSGSSSTPWTIQDSTNLPAAVDMEVDTTSSSTDDPTNLSEITFQPHPYSVKD